MLFRMAIFGDPPVGLKPELILVSGNVPHPLAGPLLNARLVFKGGTYCVKLVVDGSVGLIILEGDGTESLVNGLKQLPVFLSGLLGQFVFQPKQFLLGPLAGVISWVVNTTSSWSLVGVR